MIICLSSGFVAESGLKPSFAEPDFGALQYSYISQPVFCLAAIDRYVYPHILGGKSCFVKTAVSIK